MPFISVIIPTFKREKELIAAVRSVKEQTYKNYELIIVDDDIHASPSPAISELLSDNKNFYYYKNKRSKGACGARNSGIIVAKGEYVAFLDDDDQWLKSKLETQVLELKKLDKSSLGLLGGGFMIEESNKNHEITKGLSGNVYESLLVKNNRAPKLSTALIPKNVLIEVGMFDETLPARQDYDLYLRLARKYLFYHQAKIMAICNRDRTDRISANYAKRAEAYQVLFDKYKNELVQRPKALKKYTEKHAAVEMLAGNYWSSIKRITANASLLPLFLRLGLFFRSTLIFSYVFIQKTLFQKTP